MAGSWLSRKQKQVLIGGLVALSTLLAIDYLRWHKFVMWLPAGNYLPSREFFEGHGLDLDSVRVQTVITHLKVCTPAEVAAVSFAIGTLLSTPILGLSDVLLSSGALQARGEDT